MNDRKSIIMFYGLNANEMEKIMKITPKSCYIYAEHWQDIIAISADIIVVNPISIGEEGIGAIAEFYKEIEPSENSLILTEPCNVCCGIKKIEIVPNLFEEDAILRTTILRCMRSTATDVDFSRRLALSLLIMKYICKYPGLSTKELAQMVEISERSVKRYIDTLRTAGADIEYENKGWHCKLAIWDY